MSKPRLERVLGRVDVLSLAFGAMIGWSWVILSGEWLATGGAAGAMLAFLIGGIAIVLIGLTYAELASAMPEVGGEHAYSLRALGPGASFVCTWAIVLGYASVVAFEAVALPTAVTYLVPELNRVPLWTVAGWEVHLTWAGVGALGAVVMVVVNLLGVRTAALLQTVVTILILAGGLFLVTGTLFRGETANAEPLWVGGGRGLLGVLVMVPFMFVGFDVIPQAAEEIDLPFRSIGRLLVGSVALAVVWYLAMIGAVALALPAEGRAGAQLVTADAAAAAWGGAWAGRLLVLAGIGGILTSWNAFLVGGSRAVFALAESGMLPRPLAGLHPRYRTPWPAILLIGGLSIAAPFFGRAALVWLVDAGGLGIVVAYAFVAWSFLVLRRRQPEMPRPYRVRAGQTVGAAALILALALAALYLPGSPAALVWQEWLIVLGWVGLGIVLRLQAPRDRTRARAAGADRSD